MFLFTKCILSERHPDDGLRISVMSRHTMNDGVTPDPRIKNELYDLHFKILGPSPKLIGSYYKRGLPWPLFEAEYLQQIRASPRSMLVTVLADLTLSTNVTLLCIEEVADKCHRRLIAEECQRLRPDITVTHR